MTAVTFEQAFGEFAEIAVDAPVGFTYQRNGDGCLYVHGVEPGCIVAHWLHRYHGVSLATLAPLEGKSGANVLIRLLASGVLPPDFLGDTGAQLLKFLQVLQGYQDAGRTWSNALEGAYTLVTTPPWSVLLAPDWGLVEPDRLASTPVDA